MTTSTCLSITPTKAASATWYDMDKLIAGILIFVLFVGLVLGVWWLIWSLWTWVMPQLWPSGPSTLISPGYWLFAGMWVLLALIGRVVFGSRNEDKS